MCNMDIVITFQITNFGDRLNVTMYKKRVVKRLQIM